MAGSKARARIRARSHCWTRRYRRIRAGRRVLGDDPGTMSRTIIAPEDFYRPDHQLIFAIGTLAGEGKPCGGDVCAWSAPASRSAGGLAYLTRWRVIPTTAANVRYADIVRRLLRQLIRASTDIASPCSTTRRRERARSLVDRAPSGLRYCRMGLPASAARWRCANSARSHRSDR